MELLIAKNLVFVVLCVLTVRASFLEGENVAETVVEIGENLLLNEPSAAVDGSSLPGHLRPLGFGSIVQPIPVVNGFPKPQVFVGEYVVAESPVVFQRGTLWLGQAFTSWNEESWSTSGYGLTTMVEVTRKGSNIQEILSLRNFTKILQQEDAAIEIPVPDDLLKQTLVPRALLCDAVSSQILDVVLRFHVGEESTPLRASSSDVILCQLGGARKLTLINPMTVANKTAVLDQEGQASGVDVNRVDMTKYASLSDAEIMVTHLKPSDCVYVPAKWLHTSRMYERDSSFSIVWHHKAVAQSQQGVCGQKGGKQGDQKVTKQANTTLNDLPLINRPVATTVLPSTDFTFLHYFVDNYFKPTPVTPAEFEAQLGLDNVLFGKVLLLDQELKTIAQEIFSLLDLNKDGHLSSQDLDSADIEVLKVVSAALDASVQKLEALLLQQQQQNLTDEGTKVLVETYGNELKRILEESLQELIQQSAQETKGKSAAVESHKVLEKSAKSKLRKLIKKQQQPEPVVDEAVEEVLPEEEMTLNDNQDVKIQQDPSAPRPKKQKFAKNIKVAREPAESEVKQKEELAAEDLQQVDQKSSKKQKGSKKIQYKPNTKSKKGEQTSEQQVSETQEEVIEVYQEQTIDKHSKTKRSKGSKPNQHVKKEQGKNEQKQTKNAEQQSGGDTTEQSGTEKTEQQTGKQGRKDKTEQRTDKVQKSQQSKVQNGKSEQLNQKSERSSNGKYKNGASEQRGKNGPHGKKGKKDAGQNREQKPSKQSKVEL